MDKYKYDRCATVRLFAFLMLGLGVGVIGQSVIVAPANAQEALFINSSANVGVGTNDPVHPLHVTRSDGTGKLLVEDTSESPANQEMFELVKHGSPNFIFKDLSRAQSYTFAMLGSRFIINQQQSAGLEFELFPGGNLIISGTLTEGSSRATKRDIEGVDPKAVLDQVMALSVMEWSYKHDAPGTRHLGPMAEDFSSIFGLGASDSGISTLDTSGVALAAIQGLKAEHDAKIAEKDAEIKALKQEKDAEIEALEADLTELKDIVSRLVANGQVASIKQE